MDRYTKDSPDVFAVATLLGCDAGTGLAHHMNDLARLGRFDRGDPFGVILAAVCASHLERLVRNGAEAARELDALKDETGA